MSSTNECQTTTKVIIGFAAGKIKTSRGTEK